MPSIDSLSSLESHPFAIASCWNGQRASLEVLIELRSGFTRRFLRCADNDQEEDRPSGSCRMDLKKGLLASPRYTQVSPSRPITGLQLVVIPWLNRCYSRIRETVSDRQYLWHRGAADVFEGLNTWAQLCWGMEARYLVSTAMTEAWPTWHLLLGLWCSLISVGEETPANNLPDRALRRTP